MIYYRSEESAIQTETTGATDEDKKHLEHIPSSKREREREREQRSRACWELKNALQAQVELLNACRMPHLSVSPLVRWQV